MWRWDDSEVSDRKSGGGEFLPMDDWTEIGIFAETDQPGKPFYARTASAPPSKRSR